MEECRDRLATEVRGGGGEVSVSSIMSQSGQRFQEDVRTMKQMGLDSYRFSISWTRILPKGKLSGGVSSDGIRYYNDLIDQLLSNGIVPFVTLFHWDLPQALQDEYGGFLSPLIVSDFRDYAEVCFKEFGDRVKNWITLNEPWSYSQGGYVSGTLAPGRCSEWQKLDCLGGDSGTEPYLVSHHQLLAHAAAVQTYRLKFKSAEDGRIGISLISLWMVPLTNAMRDKKAALRSMDFMLGWFLDPLTNGDYPRTMKSSVGDRLPKFTKDESKLVKQSFDFIGINYYTSYYVAYAPSNKSMNASYATDSHAILSPSRNGVLIGKQAGSEWLYVYPRGIHDLLTYVKKKYNSPTIYITENGMDEVATLPLNKALNDTWRVDYYDSHLSFILKAIRENEVNVKGFFAWSLLDNFEWYAGYTVRFGIYYVDYKDGRKRYPKLSAKWFQSFLTTS